MLQMNFRGDPNIGLYGFATDKFCLIGEPVARKKLKKELNVSVEQSFVFDTSLVGIFCAGNSHGIVTTKHMDWKELEKIKKKFNVLALDTNYTAVGNLILMNENGALISPLIRKEKQKIAKFFSLPCEVGTIAGLRIVGTLGIATSKGCLLHPKAKKKEMKVIENVLGVEADIGTVSFGSSYPGAGIIANKNGFATSESTSGPELGRINEALGFL